MISPQIPPQETVATYEGRIAALRELVAHLTSERDSARDLLRQCWEAAGLLCEHMTGRPGQAWEVPGELVSEIERLAALERDRDEGEDL